MSQIVKMKTVLQYKNFEKKKTREDSWRKLYGRAPHLPTSNICKRAFSIAKHTSDDRWKAALPVNFEMKILLRFNISLFSIQDVSRVIHQTDKQ